MSTDNQKKKDMFFRLNFNADLSSNYDHLWPCPSHSDIGADRGSADVRYLITRTSHFGVEITRPNQDPGN